MKNRNRKRRPATIRSKRANVTLPLNAERVPRKRVTYSGLSTRVEDSLYALTFPAEMQNVSVHRMGFAELVFHGEPSLSEVTQVRGAFLDLMRTAGFAPHRELPVRTGSVIAPIIVFTSEPATAEETRDKAAALRRALQEGADLRKTKSETLLNYAKIFMLLVGSLGLIVSFTLKFPEKISASPEGGVSIEWSSPKPDPTKASDEVKLLRPFQFKRPPKPPTD